MTESTIEQNVRAREASNTLVELGISLAKDEQLEPEAVRHMWRCVMETAATLIGVEKVISSAVIVDGGKVEAPELETDCPCDDKSFPFGRYGPAEEALTYGEIRDSHYKWLAKQDWIEDWPDVLAYIQANNLD